VLDSTLRGPAGTISPSIGSGRAFAPTGLGSLSGSRPFGVDGNICSFLWYGGFAGEGLRSDGVDDLPLSKSGCSILPIARRLSGRGPAGPRPFIMPVAPAALGSHPVPTRPSLCPCPTPRGLSYVQTWDSHEFTKHKKPITPFGARPHPVGGPGPIGPARCGLSRHHELLMYGQPVEKVGIGQAGGPREPENASKTLRERCIRPLDRGRSEREGVFQQAGDFYEVRVALKYKKRAGTLTPDPPVRSCDLP
jgi:hypothetical protein